MPPKNQKIPRGADRRFLARKSLTNFSTNSSITSSAESSPLDTSERRYNELENSSDREDSEHESNEVQRQLNQNDEDDLESLRGAPHPELTILPTFNSHPIHVTVLHTGKAQTSIQSWPTPPIKDTTAPTPAKHVFQSKPSPPAPMQKKMATSNTPNWFHGRPDENAQNFLHEVERYILLSDLKTDSGKIVVFSTLLSAGSIADTWWDKLDSAKKTSWTDVKAAFSARWPAIRVAEKTGLDYQREILALRLKDEELGTQIAVAGVHTWAHLQYQVSLQQLVNEAGAASTAGLVYQVCENLPAVMKELTTPGVVDWTTFLDKIQNIDTNKLREKAEAARKKKEVEKAQNARLARLENMQTDAIEVLRMQLQRTDIGSAQAGQTFTSNNSSTSPCIRYVAKGQQSSTQQQYCQRQPLTAEERNALRRRINDIPHHPNNAAGRTAYEEQLRQWFAMYGEKGRVTENTQFPLQPGSAMICSGECFKCGAHGHVAADCKIPEMSQLSIQEKIWRSIAARALGNFNRENAVQIDVAFENDYEQQDQGKGQGSSV